MSEQKENEQGAKEIGEKRGRKKGKKEKKKKKKKRNEGGREYLVAMGGTKGTETSDPSRLKHQC